MCAKNSGIEWTDDTFNPWWGCLKVSPGCDNCYAETWAARMGHKVWGPEANTPRRFFGDKHWKEPEVWNRAAAKAGVRRRVFCGSMCDWAEDRADLVPHRARLFDLIQRTPWLDWLLLTKRIDRAARLLPWSPPFEATATGRPTSWAGWGRPWDNVWVGTTVEDRKRAAARIPVLEGIPAAVRFLSMEPLIEDVDLDPYLWRTCASCNGAGVVGADGEACNCARYSRRPGYTMRRPFDWAIVGCESGDGMRPARAAWFRRTRDQVKRAELAFFLKQAMREADGGEQLITIGAGSHVKRDLVVVAPELDGRAWAEFPTPRAAA